MRNILREMSSSLLRSQQVFNLQTIHCSAEKNDIILILTRNIVYLCQNISRDPETNIRNSFMSILIITLSQLQL